MIITSPVTHVYEFVAPTLLALRIGNKSSPNYYQTSEAALLHKNEITRSNFKNKEVSPFKLNLII